eukprot:5169476-Lingulodinium_polyedra.AAC.1
MVDIKRVIALAGLISWVGSVITWARAFNSLLWAAISAHQKEGDMRRQGRGRWRPHRLFFVKRVRRAL